MNGRPDRSKSIKSTHHGELGLQLLNQQLASEAYGALGLEFTEHTGELTSGEETTGYMT